MKVKIVSITERTKYKDLESVEVYVDDEFVGRGFYGGEPEDNSRIIDYSWVEELIEKLSEKLGAEVVYDIKEMKDD